MHLDVLDLLQRLGIPFKKTGAKVLANCPARTHNDTTQRWMIRDDRSDRWHGTHRCLSCGFSGGPVKLVIEHLDCTRAEAMEFMASSERGAPVKLDVEVQVRDAPTTQVRVPPEVQFAEWYDWPEAHAAYLAERCVNAQQVTAWGIGFIEQASVSTPMLRKRIWIPVRDHQQQLRGWTARTITKNAQPKYLSSSRADGASQSVLLGEHTWPPAPERDTLVVTEGPFDALAVDRAGYAVAALRGSELDPGQVQKLSTWKRLLVAVDPDKAGFKAMVAINALKRHVQVQQVVLTTGEDVADLAVRDPDELLLVLQRATAGLSDHG